MYWSFLFSIEKYCQLQFFWVFNIESLLYLICISPSRGRFLVRFSFSDIHRDSSIQMRCLPTSNFYAQICSANVRRMAKPLYFKIEKSTPRRVQYRGLSVIYFLNSEVYVKKLYIVCFICLYVFWTYLFKFWRLSKQFASQKAFINDVIQPNFGESGYRLEIRSRVQS